MRSYTYNTLARFLVGLFLLLVLLVFLSKKAYPQSTSDFAPDSLFLNFFPDTPKQGWLQLSVYGMKSPNAAGFVLGYAPTNRLYVLSYIEKNSGRVNALPAFRYKFTDTTGAYGIYNIRDKLLHAGGAFKLEKHGVTLFTNIGPEYDFTEKKLRGYVAGGAMKTLKHDFFVFLETDTAKNVSFGLGQFHTKTYWELRPNYNYNTRSFGGSLLLCFGGRVR